MANNVNSFWSKNITEEEKTNLFLLTFDDNIVKNLSFLHHNKYTENSNRNHKRQITFYYNDCIWQIEYILGWAMLTLQCVFEPNEDIFNYSFERLIDNLLCEANYKNKPIVRIQTKNNNHFVIVTHYSME